MDTFSSLKYLGAALSAAYGFYATVTDFRVESDGKKRLSRKGSGGLAFLSLSTIISLAGDAGKDLNAQKKELADRAFLNEEFSAQLGRRSR